jgi:Cellulose biosynthesis protein BcsS
MPQCGWITALRPALVLALLVFSQSTRAEPPVGNSERKNDRHYEVWAGADAAEDVWLLYSGATLAPFGDIHQDGLRLRFAGGYGQYRYQSFDVQSRTLSPFDADVSFADALIGYLWRLDPLILKLFVGASFSDHQIQPFDYNNKVQGPEFGVKAVAELWFNLGETGYASLDVAWSEAHETRSARARLGYRLNPVLSFGPEIGLNIDRQGDYKIYQEDLYYRAEPIDYGRLGLFARYEWYGGELGVSAGLLGDFREETTAYGTINWISQF